MDEKELKEIEEEYSMPEDGLCNSQIEHAINDYIPALIAEVRRLRKLSNLIAEVLERNCPKEVRLSRDQADKLAGLKSL